VCQLFLLVFHDWMGLEGRWIDENEFYFELRDHNFLLPTTWRTSDMVSISPGETELLLNLLLLKSEGRLPAADYPTIEFTTERTQYDPVYGPDLTGARTKDGIVAAALTDPSRLPSKTRPDGDAIGCNVPISPYRPGDVPVADIGYYSNRPIRDGTLPNTLLYLDVKPAGEEMRSRIDRQFKWLDTLLGEEIYDVEVVALAPEFTDGFYESVGDQTTAALNEILITLSGSGL